MSEQFSFKGQLRPVLVSAVFFMLLTGLVYPLATTGVTNVLFPWQAHGSLIRENGKIVGAKPIGQQFTGLGYFHSRPSATAGYPYNAMASGASNLGPTNPELIKHVAERVKRYRKINGLSADTMVPVDAVTASASGLDPDISVANARLQAARVARARGLTTKRVLELVSADTTPRPLGLFGEPRVNVLKINQALDALSRQ